jgi:hypothetical protein
MTQEKAKKRQAQKPEKVSLVTRLKEDLRLKMPRSQNLHAQMGIQAFTKKLADAMEEYGVQKKGFGQKDLLPTGAVLAGLILEPLKEREGSYVTACVSRLKGVNSRRYAYRFLKERVHEFDTHECMVDIYCCEGVKDPYRTLLTMECEAATGHGRDLSSSATSDDCDYLWDLFKLLQVPSPLRIFLSIAKSGMVDELEKHIGKLIRNYQPHLGNDEVFSVVFPGKRLLGERIRVFRWSGPVSAPETHSFLSGRPS